MRPHYVNRIDHVVICIEPENIHRAAETFSALLDIGFEGPYEFKDSGLLLYIDWHSGIELTAPVDPEIAVEQARFLEEHGEGLFRVVFGFADRDEALARAEAMGIRTLAKFDVLSWGRIPHWSDKFDKLLESNIETVHGVRLDLCQIEPKKATAD